MISIRRLNFAYTNSIGERFPVLHDVNMRVEPGSRVLLIGANGTGKTTLLKILAGRHLVVDPESEVLVMNEPPFYQTLGLSGIEFLGNNMWQRSVAFVGTAINYEADFAVREMMAELQNEFRERRDAIVKVLDIDLEWRMNTVSDGQRRRVQILLGLLRPFKVLLVDEMTVDLDVLSRKNLLDYLLKESVERGATIVYCTHIFDGIDGWPSHLAWMARGTIVRFDAVTSSASSAPAPSGMNMPPNGHSPPRRIYELALDFLIACKTEDDERRRRRRREGTVEAAGGEKSATASEPFGGEGFGAGRLQPSTRFTSSFSRRMDAYR